MRTIAPTSNRLYYDRQTYARLLTELTKTMETVPHLMPSRDDWDIEGDWTTAGHVHFIDSRHMEAFANHAGFDCRSIKLINYDKPAIRLNFYKKHAYWLLKGDKLTTDEKMGRVTDYVNQLTIQIEITTQKLPKLRGTVLSNARGQLARMQQQIRDWQDILDNLNSHEIVISNYKRESFYTFVNFKYRLETGDLANLPINLLTTQHDRRGNVTKEKHNIIFVDTEQIGREHPYQNKEIDQYLASFPLQSEFNRDHIYARHLVETPFPPTQTSIQSLEASVLNTKPTKSDTVQSGQVMPTTPPLFPDWTI